MVFDEEADACVSVPVETVICDISERIPPVPRYVSQTPRVFDEAFTATVSPDREMPERHERATPPSYTRRPDRAASV